MVGFNSKLNVMIVLWSMIMYIYASDKIDEICIIWGDFNMNI